LRGGVSKCLYRFISSIFKNIKIGKNGGKMGKSIYERRDYLLKDRTYDTGLWNTFAGRLLTASSPPTDKTLGVDVSHWNGLSDFYKMKSKGIQFGVFKGTDVGWGSKKPFTDEGAQYNYSEMKKATMLIGSYCWLDPNPYSNATEQANYFVDNIYLKYEINLPPVCDFEDRDYINPNDMLQRLKVWLEIVEQRTGKLPIIYTSPGYMSAFDKSKTDFLERYPLWVAHYIQRTYPSIPYPWDNYLIWQYTDRGHYPYYVWNSGTMHGREWGSDSSYLDMNWFNGTMEDLLEFCETEELPTPPEPPQPPEEDEFLFKAKCTAWLLNVRNRPGMIGKIVDSIGRDSVHKVYEERNGWYRIGEDKWVSGYYMTKVSDDSGDTNSLFQAKCKVYRLNTRTGPSITYPISKRGQLKQGEIVNVYEINKNWFKISPDSDIWVSGYSSYMERIV
jgi:GH25 family lysozyme M1 (1,4-beta-N-acetylmuramidase)